MKRNMGFAAAAAAVAGLLWVLSGASTAIGAGELVGKDAPEISAGKWLNTGDKPVALKDLKGKVVVVEFWATWCPPCKKATPHLVELYEKNKEKGLVVVSLSGEALTELPKVESFVKEYKMTYIVGVASKTGGAYGVRGIPHAAVLDKSGKIVWMGHPMDPAFTKTVEEQLAAK